MISFADPGADTFLANLTRIENANAKTQQQISSGVRVSAPEDAPDQVGQLLQLQASLSRNGQIQKNLAGAQTLGTAADQALTTTLQLLDQAGSMAAQGASSNASTQTRQNLSQQIQSIFGQIVSLSQTSVAGRFVFGGDNDRTPPYQLDSASLTGVDRLSTALNTALVEDPNGGSFAAGLTAGQIFDHRNPDDSVASDNVFAALQSLSQALANDDTSAISAAMFSLTQASDYVNAQQSFYGNLENRITQAQTSATSINLSLTKQISDIRDTDFTQAALQLTQGQTQLQAALEARSKVPHTSLFDFLA